jgi:hypothetical protein
MMNNLACKGKCGKFKKCFNMFYTRHNKGLLVNGFGIHVKQTNVQTNSLSLPYVHDTQNKQVSITSM